MSSEETVKNVPEGKPASRDPSDGKISEMLEMLYVAKENAKNLQLTTESESAVISEDSGTITGKADAPSNAVVFNTENRSLKSLLTYGSDESTDSSSESSESTEEDDSDEEESEDTDSDSTSTEDEDDAELCTSNNKGAIKKTDKISESSVMELGFNNLPPVPDLSELTIDVSEDFEHVGYIEGIVEQIVTVQSLPDHPAYDLETVLFFGEERQPLGRVFDVFGPVKCPIYAIRFNKAKDIEDKKIQKGMKVYSSPKSNYTNYIFMQELLLMKGSDASWVGDAEVPQEFQEFSDDEREVKIKSKNRLDTHTRKRPHSSLERHKRFERTMNQCNTLNTRVHKLMDSKKQIHSNDPRTIARSSNASSTSFDPCRPPPGYTELHRPIPVQPGQYPPAAFMVPTPSTHWESYPSFVDNETVYGLVQRQAWGTTPNIPQGTWSEHIPVPVPNNPQTGWGMAPVLLPQTSAWSNGPPQTLTRPSDPSTMYRNS